MQKVITKCLLLTISILSLIGCSQNNLHVTYKTDISGASLCHGNTCYHDFTPLDVTYELTPEEIASGKKIINNQATSLVWASGARLNLKPEIIDLKNGLQQELFYVRPKNSSNIQIDISVAQLQEIKILQKKNEERMSSMESRIESIENKFEKLLRLEEEKARRNS